MSEVVRNHSRNTIRTARKKQLGVMGVRKGSQSCSHDHVYPWALKETSSGDRPADFYEEVFETPIVPGNNAPAILGLETMTDQRALLDLVINRLYLAGLGDFDPMIGALPP